MDALWWPAAALVAVLALITTLIDGYARGHRPRRRRRREDGGG